MILIVSCKPEEKKIEIDNSKHQGLVSLQANQEFEVLHSQGHVEHAKRQLDLIQEAYQFLEEIMGPKKDFCLLVIAEKDWKKNAYSPVLGMPEYYKGNLIVGAGHNSMAEGYGEMIASFPEEMTSPVYAVYASDGADLDMKLFFDKLSVHELTHSFQDPMNGEGFSMSRWLEEIHANMGLYAFYKYQKPEELKYVTSLVDFSLENPPPGLKYTSLADFDKRYYDMSPDNYGFYQMRFTKTAQQLVEALGKDVLKPLNEFIKKYDESWKGKLNEEEFRDRLAEEVDPQLVAIIESWSDK